VALLRLNLRPGTTYAERLEAGEDPHAILQRELAEGDDRQLTLLADAEPAALLERAEADVAGWRRQGMTVATVLDPEYPRNLRAVHDRPALVFVLGELRPQDTRAVAMIGSRRAVPEALDRARHLATALVRSGYTVVSGLAAGVDTAAHTATLAGGGRTVAVIGTGLLHAYPAENAELQRTIARNGAVVSQFWPSIGAKRENFPLRNGTMSGLALATVIVDASYRSGARIQARLALAHGRPVFLAASLLDQEWAQDLRRRPGVFAFDGAEEILAALERLHAPGELTA
jgi:DNA processing protein